MKKSFNKICRNEIGSFYNFLAFLEYLKHFLFTGSIQDPEPNAPAFEDLQDKRPSTVLEIGSDGIAAMSSPQAPPARLPPLAGGSNDGDGLGGYRQNLDIDQMNMPEVSTFEFI